MKPKMASPSWLSRSLDSVRRVPSGKMVNVYGMASVMFNKAKSAHMASGEKGSTSSRGFLENWTSTKCKKRMGRLKSNWQSQRSHVGPRPNGCSHVAFWILRIRREARGVRTQKNNQLLLIHLFLLGIRGELGAKGCALVLLRGFCCFGCCSGYGLGPSLAKWPASNRRRSACQFLSAL